MFFEAHAVREAVAASNHPNDNASRLFKVLYAVFKSICHSQNSGRVSRSNTILELM